MDMLMSSRDNLCLMWSLYRKQVLRRSDELVWFLDSYHLMVSMEVLRSLGEDVVRHLVLGCHLSLALCLVNYDASLRILKSWLRMCVAYATSKRHHFQLLWNIKNLCMFLQQSIESVSSSSRVVGTVSGLSFRRYGAMLLRLIKST